MTEFRDEDLFPEDALAELSGAFGEKTDGQLREEFFDMAAWLRDVDTSRLPKHVKVTVQFERMGELGIYNPATGETKRLGEQVPMRYSLERYPEPIESGETLRCVGPGVSAYLSDERLEEKRPRP